MAPASVLNPSRFADALAYATTLHAKQRRKGTDIPYIAHLLGVASLALEHRPDEDLADRGAAARRGRGPGRRQDTEADQAALRRPRRGDRRRLLGHRRRAQAAVAPS